MSTIPASTIVSVIPSVLGVGGDAIDVVALMLTTSTRIPLGTVQEFDSLTAVNNYFGGASNEATEAGVYFQGFDNSSKKPAKLLMAQYNTGSVSAFVRGAVNTLTLAQIQALNQLFSVTIDGIVKSGTVNLAAATSFSSAGNIIADQLDIEGTQGATFTGSITTTVLTVSAFGAGTPLAPGQFIKGAGVTADTYITSLGTGTGGTGTYNVSNSQSVGSEAMTSNIPGVTFDSISSAFQVNSGTTGATSTITFPSGALATSLSLTQVQGAVISQGAIAAVPATFMNAVVQVTSDWVTFMTLFDPDGGSGNAVKQAFAAWKNTQGSRFAYVVWDTDPTPAASFPAAASLGQILAANGDSGTCLVWEPSNLHLAAFACGAAASIDFEKKNGRITFAFKAQAGLTPSVTDPTTAANLGGNPQAQTLSRGNGYNFYGAYAQGNNSFLWFQRGFVTGPFAWFDSYINQVWLNANLQGALLNLFQNALSIPFNDAGASILEQGLADPIAAGLNFGAYAPGTISASQIAAINQAAGADVANTLQTQGYYLQVLPAPDNVRAARGPWAITFWYLDRGSVQSVVLSSVAVQ